MNVVTKIALISMIALATQMGCAGTIEKPVELFSTSGDVSRPESGWTYQAGSEEEMVYIPFEGMYPNKGGRMQSPWFTIPVSDRGAYYRLAFTARTAEHCYWWLDYRDKDGIHIPDCNSEVYPGDAYRDYDEVVYVPSAVRQVQIAFVSKAKVEAKDISFTPVTAAEAAQWCDDLYKTLPPLKFTAPPGSMALLPKAAAAMKDGTPWRVVMLGHSLMNDAFNSLFMAMVQREFPASRFDVVASVRGSTGCSYFRQPEHFAKYVLEKKPDLLMIISSREGAAVEDVVKMAREQVGCEVLIMNNPFARDWREQSETLDWRSVKGRSGAPAFDMTAVRDCAAKLGVAFWDVTTPCNDYWAAAGDIDLKRDYVHNNDNGKQIIGRILHQYFLTAK